MTPKLAGKTVLITGAAGGIGFACARACLESGAQVVLADIDADKALAAVDELGGDTTSVALDVGDVQAIRTVVSEVSSQVGRIDVLINNAAAFDMAPLLQVEPADFERLFRINVQGAFFVMQAVARQMKADGMGGSIINMASQAGRQAEPASSVYAATKAAVISFTRSAAIALVKDDIRVNAIAPGVIETPMWDRIDEFYTRQYGVAAGEKRKQVGASVPIGRMGTPAEIASAAVFLASTDSAYIIGQTLNVDGGTILS